MMTCKRWFGLMGVAAFVLGGWASPAAARSQAGTLVIVPARYSVMQVGFDLVARYGVSLLSYQGEAKSDSVLLYRWSGKEWQSVSVDEFQQGGFMQPVPARVLLLGEAAMVPPTVATGLSWAKKVERIETVDTAEILNRVGPLLGFGNEDWAWFGKRYNMTLKDLNAPARKLSWYDFPFVEKPKASAAKP